MGRDFREESRKDYLSGNDGCFSCEQLQTGALLRIADSLEKMQKPFKQMLDDVEWYKNRDRIQNLEIAKLLKSNAAYRGIINRRKKA
jgi:hypothetical protein